MVTDFEQFLAHTATAEHHPAALHGLPHHVQHGTASHSPWVVTLQGFTMGPGGGPADMSVGPSCASICLSLCISVAFGRWGTDATTAMAATTRTARIVSHPCIVVLFFCSLRESTLIFKTAFKFNPRLIGTYGEGIDT